jgi:cation-transporting ATPase 13A1
MADKVNKIAAKDGPGKNYSFQLLSKKKVQLRWDVLPLAFTVPAIWYQFGSKIFDREELVPVLTLMAAITFHALTFFLNFWNADINILFCYDKLGESTELAACSDVWVKIENKKLDTIKKHIVPLQSESVEIQPGQLQTVYSIEVMKKKMLWSNEARLFRPVPYPVKDTIDFYQSAVGLQDADEEAKALLVWGNNTMKIPIPTFIELYKEHLVAPFFVF